MATSPGWKVRTIPPNVYALSHDENDIAISGDVLRLEILSANIQAMVDVFMIDEFYRNIGATN